VRSRRRRGRRVADIPFVFPPARHLVIPLATFRKPALSSIAVVGDLRFRPDPSVRRRDRRHCVGCRAARTALPQSHGCDSAAGPVALTAGDRGIVRPPAGRRHMTGGSLGRSSQRANLATPVTWMSLGASRGFGSRARRRPLAPGRSRALCQSFHREGLEEAREVAAGGFLMDAGPGT
jgi:hypothetical protein